MALLAISETNAYLIHNTMLKRAGLAQVSHYEFKEKLAQALLDNPYCVVQAEGPSRSEAS